ncbi:hypothetical protein J3459_013610 [Metarhizium acridum]|uniref:AA1-like domain-containing protein n=1 Tax=Metarhizium acridum (strain CQMa 102) TaxID=655827 RepID=E9DSD5_METAQ|nr:uncharacterized protein MAC_00533 [Metarhizium acridum CQMa 102]EFY93295.1 hypothetical protein MAC_00533 [Metarhizium acridum CQMa 102]KAG8416822.1 hypothetical protein J3459_013610 [Metarhizium acridum]KAG8421734.1 hypothetical protein J3458_003583 [Metarhizium acridum]
MKFTLFFLASMPATFAAKLAYTPPAALAVKAEDPKNNCVLPADYHIRSFTAATNGTGDSLTSYKFTFLDTATNSSTRCEYGPASKAQDSASGGTLPRYSCDSADVSFVWQGQMKKLSMIQKVCPDDKGQAEYEVAGSVVIPLTCSHNACQTNATDYTGTFNSLNAVEHAPTVRRHRGVAWSYDLAN